MRARLLAFALLAFAAGCTPMPSVPAPPPPDKAPLFAEPVALLPYFRLGSRVVPAGTGFVVADAACKWYLLTAAHLMDDAKEWNNVQHIALQPWEEENWPAARASRCSSAGRSTRATAGKTSSSG